MIQLFEEDYNLVKRGISIGTDVLSSSSSTTGYYDGNVYINSDTLDIWKLINEVWTKQGNLKGILSITEIPSSSDDGLNTITVTLTDGTTQTLTVKNGSKGVQGVSVTGVVDNGDGTFALMLSNGTRTGNVATIKGDKGDSGSQGEQGIAGRGITSVTSTDNGKNHVLSANFTDGTSNIITTIRDGADGLGGGDMYMSTYDVNENGIVDAAESISDGTRTLTFNDIDSKANKATSLSGYGITDAYTKTEVDDLLDNVEIDVDTELSLDSENPVENKAIAKKLLKATYSTEIEDNITEQGYYFVQNADNKFTSEYLEVIKLNNTLIKQIAYDYISENFATRQLVEGTWSEWKDVGSKVYNPNLLDNGWFTVNQRGQSSYTSARTTPYTIDRWRIGWNNKIEIVEGGIKLSRLGTDALWFQQFIADKSISGKLVTVSVLADNKIEQATFTFPVQGEDKSIILTNGYYIHASDTTSNPCSIRFSSDNWIGKTIRAIKLELGSVSTLANDVEPNYQEELIRCQTSTADATDTYANKTLNLVENADFLNNGNLMVRSNFRSAYFRTGTPITNDAGSGTVYIECEPNTTYTISKKSGKRFGVAEADDIVSGTPVSNYIENATGSSITFTTTNKKYLLAWVWESIDTISKEDMLDTVKIEKGATPTERIMSNAELTKKVNRGATPTVSQITFASGSSTDTENCTIVDYGNYCIVNVSAYTGSRDAIMLNLPRPALVKTTVKVPYNNYAMSALTVEANSTEVKIKDYQINSNSFSMLIPLKSN